MHVCVFCSDAPLTIQNVKLQLNGGRRKGEGIVEVGIGSAWGAVCIDHWEMHAAKLICKSLGYKTALASVKNEPLRNKFAARDLLHFVNHFRCSGKETSIDECDLLWETGQCQGEPDAYAGVVCSGEHSRAQADTECMESNLPYTLAQSNLPHIIHNPIMEARLSVMATSSPILVSHLIERRS